MAVDVTEAVDDGGVRVHFRPGKGRAALSVLHVFASGLVAVGTKAVLAVEIYGVGPTLKWTNGPCFKGHRCEEERHQEEAAHTQNLSLIHI